MSLSKIKVMFLRDMLCACAFLHLSPSFYRSIESALVVKPQNVAVVSGEKVVLNCTSDVSKENIAWNTLNPGSSDREYTYDGNKLIEKVTSYISVPDDIDGSRNLHINTSVAAAKRYICADRTTGEEASAELVIFENHAQCNYNYEALIVTCTVMFAGGWPPNLQCKQWNEAKKRLHDLEGTNTTVVNNNVVTRTWTYANKNSSYDISCFVKFEESERPKETTATNIPSYKYSVPAYHGTEKKQPVEDHTTVAPGSSQPLLNGLIVWAVANVAFVTGAVAYVVTKKVRKLREVIAAKKNSDEEMHIHGDRVGKA